MRFEEFNILLELDAGRVIYTVGDSHAEGIANFGGKGWKSLAIRGSASDYPANTTTPNPKHVEAVQSIPKGSTVVICLGCNDAANAALAQSKGSRTLTPQQVASNIKHIVDLAVAHGLNTIFVVYPVSTKPGPYGSPYSQKCRTAIKNTVTGVPVIDMGDADTYDGVHASAGPYKAVAEKALTIGQFQQSPIQQTSTTSAKKVGYYGDQYIRDLAAGNDPLKNQVALARSKKTAPKVGYNARPSGIVVNPNDIKSYLASKSLDKNQIAGIMANIEHESSFDSGGIGDGNTSGGLFQHHNSQQEQRFSKMVRAAGGPNQWAKNWKGQVDFALSEPAGREYASIKNFPNPEAASRWWTLNFEIPENKESKAISRSKDARKYAS